MKTLIPAAILIMMLSGFLSAPKVQTNIEIMTNPESQPDTTPKVLGIGGIFFFSEDPGKLKDWYSTHLGMPTDQYGTMFRSRNADNPEQMQFLQWSPFMQGSEYFKPSKKEFMINYIVQNLEGLKKQLEESGVTIVDTIAEYDYGKFLHIMDEEGNKIELWEPAGSGF